MTCPEVLLISSNSSAYGGGERYLVYLAEGLRRIGSHVSVLVSEAPHMDRWAAALALRGAVVVRRRLKNLRDRRLRFLSAVCDFAQIQRVAEVCRQLRPNVVIVNQQYDEDGLDYLMGASAARIAPVCAVMHMPMSLERSARPFGVIRRRLLKQWYQRHESRRIFVSKAGLEEFSAVFGPSRRHAVVHNGVVLPTPVDLCRRKNGVATIGFCGRFVPQKNLVPLIDAWLGLRRDGSDCRLLLVGDGPERGVLESRIHSEHAWNYCAITGWTENPESLLRTLDVFALTSLFEGCPLSLLEAAGMGIPAIITPFSGANDVAETASWIHVARAFDSRAILEALRIGLSNQGPRREELEKFRSYFSVERMALQTSAVAREEEYR